jgi:hypothetical protein
VTKLRQEKGMRLLKYVWVHDLSLGVLKAARGSEEGMIKDEGVYRNPNYLYAITLPPGVVCLSDPPPVPQHGCGIQLSEDSSAYLWVDGSYNTLERVSSSDALRDQCDEFLQEGTEVVVLKHVSTLLGDLPAERLTVRYRKVGEITATVKDVVVGLRGEIENYGDMIYTIGLISPESRFANDDKIFEAILQSWTNELPSKESAREGQDRK